MNSLHVSALIDDTQQGGLLRSRIPMVSTLDARAAIVKHTAKHVHDAESQQRASLYNNRCMLARLIASEDEWPLAEADCPAAVHAFVCQLERDVTKTGPEQLLQWKAQLRQWMRRLKASDSDTYASIVHGVSLQELAAEREAARVKSDARLDNKNWDDREPRHVGESAPANPVTESRRVEAAAANRRAG